MSSVLAAAAGVISRPAGSRVPFGREKARGRLGLALLAVVGFLCAGLVAAWWVAPEQLRQQVESRGTEALGRTVRLQQLEVGLRPLRLTLKGLEVGGVAVPAAAPASSAPLAADGAGAAGRVPHLLTLRRLELEVDAWSLWRREPEITRLLVEGLDAHLARSAAGTWSVDDLLRRFRPAEGSEKKPSAPAPVLTLKGLELREARLIWQDDVQGQRHELSSLNLALPWWSNRPADAQREITPRLTGRFNGAALSLEARAWPARSQPGLEARLAISDLNLAPLWAWWPPDLPLRPQHGRFEAQLQVRAQQAPGGAWQWGLAGPAALSGLALVNAQGGPLASLERLELELRDARSSEKSIELGSVRLVGAQVHVRRDRSGRLEWATLAAAAAPTTAQAEPGAPAWSLRTGPVALERLQLHWFDEMPRPAVRARVSPLDLRVDQVSWPVRGASAFQLEARLEPPGAAKGAPPQPVRLALSGTASDQAAQLSWRVGGVSLASWQPYLQSVLRPALRGSVRGEGALEWAAGDRPRLQARVRALELQDFEARVPSISSPGLAWKSLKVEELRADLLARQLSLGQVTWTEPVVRARRSAHGALGLAGVYAGQDLLVSQGPGSGSLAQAGAAASPAARPAAGAPGWRAALGRVRVTGAHLDIVDEQVPSDRQPGAPWSMSLHPVMLDVERLAWPPAPTPANIRLSVQWPQSPSPVVFPAGPSVSSPAAPSAAPSTAANAATNAAPVSAALAASEEPALPAVFNLQGSLRLDTPAFQGVVQAERWPLPRFEPQWVHLGVALPVKVSRADLALDSRLDLRLGPQGLETQGEGAVRLADVQVLSAPGAGWVQDGATKAPPVSLDAAPVIAAPSPGAEELARWNLLEVDGLRWQVVPGQTPRVQAGLVRLSDFFARLEVTEAGRLNLQDVTAPRPGAAGAGGASTVPSASVSRPDTTSPVKEPAGLAPSEPTRAAGAAKPPPTTGSRPLLDWSVDRTEWVNGRVDFIDRFIRPNYAADLTELNGSLGRFESGSTAMAPLELRGRAARTALLEIRGAVNPTASPLMLDLSARATDLELAPLSPYGGKYVGYAIERGKLSVDLSYRIDADGKLEARNQIILNQLTFGERVNSPQATSLPVRLALALLADRNGVIDINLPISGSINEPQFSIMGLVWRMIGNLLVKVVTAPFAWLAGSGTQDLSAVRFEPGAARLEGSAQQSLDQLHRALTDRPALRMTITGRADPDSEATALRRAALDERLTILLRREAARVALAGPAPAAPSALPASGSEAYAALVRRLYADTPLPNKPRNLLGLLTTPPVPQMEALLLAAMPVNENVARELALQRALAVRDALIARGLPAERLFLAAPQVGVSGGVASPEARLAITGP